MTQLRRMKLQGYVSEDNSSTTLLGADEVFTGSAVDILDYGIIFVAVHSDVDSATDGLSIQQSTDGVNWHFEDVFTIKAGTAKNFSINPYARYLRVVYTNGSEAQGEFHLSTILKANSKPSSHRIQDTISNDDDGELVKAVITGENGSGNFINFSSTHQGNFKVAVQEYGDTPSIDAFDRLRTSFPYTIFDSKQLHDKQPLFWDESIGGSATSVHSPTDAKTRMTVTANASDFVIRQTKQRFNYQPGKSQLILLTFHSESVAGTTKRVGVFSGTGTNNLTANNGIFFKLSGTDVSWNIAKNGTVTESVSQNDWNYDKLDGTGLSGLTLDANAPQILIIDYEWLGVGRVRVGFVIDGLIRYCHYFNHANNDSFPSVYMSTPNLPVRYDVQTDGTAGTLLDHICSTVMSEGGIEQTGILRAIDTGSTYLDANVSGTTYALLGIRLKSSYSDITVVPEYMSMLALTNDSFRWSLQLNPTVAGTFTYSDITNSALQRATGVTTNTITSEGLIIDSGYANASTSINRKFLTALRLGMSIAGTADSIVLCVTPLGNQLDIHGSLTFRELL